MKSLTLIIVSILINLNGISQVLSIDEKVDSVLNLMSLEEKIGQMTQAERGALENDSDIATYGIGSLLSGGGSSPSSNTVAGWANMYDTYQSIALQSNLSIPLIYGIDAVHGHNNVYGAVLFPHNIGMGCTWNPELVNSANQIIAKEVAATGIDWTFAPCIAVPQNERWGRTYEGFGETAEIQKIMAKESVLGLQGTDLSNNETILACAKHFVGDGGTTDGNDQGNTVVTEEVLREVHMAGYIDAIQAGVGSVMASYNSWNGQKLHAHDYLLTDVLKNELGFEGFVISDWKGVDQIDEDYRESVKRAINAGIDMVMVPDRYIYFISIVKSLVEDNEISIDRIDDAVRRILKQKFLLNLFEEPYTDISIAASFGSQEHRDVARQTVRESVVLLNAKNDILPLKKNNQKILVVGSLAKDLGAQCGGWSISWQGSNGEITIGIDILTGIQNLSESSEIIYSETGDYDGDADIAVVVIGEKNPYAEGEGDRSSLDIDSEDLNQIKNFKEKGIPTIAVLISGRPMIISEALPYTDAFLAAWLPGTEGDGIAEILFGDFAPSGQLTHTWPSHKDQIPINFGDENYNPLFEYKHGLQNFPDSISSEKLLPYAATTSIDGKSIILTLSDIISDVNYEYNDFKILNENSSVPYGIDALNIANFDTSILIIELSSEIEPNEKITIEYSGNGIYSSNLVLDNFTGFFVHNIANSNALAKVVPGKIEAEDFYEMNGIQTESCTDAGGGLNVGFIEAGDWMKYNIDVTQSGLYNMTGRISGYNGGTLSVSFNDTIESSINYTSTNAWQNWQDFSSELYLEEGNYNMKTLAQSDAFNINYFNFGLISSVKADISSIKDIKVFPNPLSSDLNIEFLNNDSRTVSIKLIDITGKSVNVLYQGQLNKGVNLYSFYLDSNLPTGIYFIEIKDESKRYFKKVLKE